MNKKPVSYLQIDPKWKSLRYPCNGGTMSIGGGGCGPTSAAMLAETLSGKTCTPVDAMKWACSKGYVTANQGTDYAFFKPFFKERGIECDILTWTQCMSAESPIRERVINMLKEGYYFIALMKPGNWTSGGHYVVVWWSDGKVRINDPASTRDDRLNGDHTAFWSTAKYFWWVDARNYNNPKQEDEYMTGEQIYKELNTYLAKQGAPDWARNELQEAIELGITDGTLPMQLIPRYQAAIMAKRATKKAIEDVLRNIKG